AFCLPPVWKQPGQSTNRGQAESHDIDAKRRVLHCRLEKSKTETTAEMGNETRDAIRSVMENIQLLWRTFNSFSNGISFASSCVYNRFTVEVQS
ncbi:MAG: hypothetical protein ACRDBM_11820, partial [Sporomusa sp.]